VKTTKWHFSKRMAIIIAAAITVGIAACSSNAGVSPIGSATSNFSVQASVDGVSLSVNQPIKFDKLEPGQTQMKNVIVKNNGNVAGIIKKLDIEKKGTLFTSGTATITVTADDGVALKDRPIAVNQTIKATVVLKIADQLKQGETGSISLDFNAVPNK
jgi:hypothetical protein